MGLRSFHLSDRLCGGWYILYNACKKNRFNSETVIDQKISYSFSFIVGKPVSEFRSVFNNYRMFIYQGLLALMCVFFFALSSNTRLLVLLIVSLSFFGFCLSTALFKGLAKRI